MQAALWTWNEPYLKHTYLKVIWSALITLETEKSALKKKNVETIFTQKWLVISNFARKMAANQQVTELNIK